jgi:hypothetical protein
LIPIDPNPDAAGPPSVKSSRSLRSLVANVPLPGPDAIQPRRPNPDYGRFNVLTGSGSRSANRLGLDLVKRLSSGFTLQAGYSWNREFNDERGEPNDPRNLKAERAPDGEDQDEFRVQFFNAFNNVNFSRPNSTFGTSLFGRIFGAGRAREIELALKYSF